MRVLSSRTVLEQAEQIERTILDTYLEPDKTIPELREMANSGTLDLLRTFSEACRAEFELLRAQQF
jgi:DNA-binding transcriptional regulator YhcF (GntR family)